MTARYQRNKYGAKRTNGYHSAREAKRAAELKLLERSGEITDLREQVPFVLLEKQIGERGVKIIVDFTYRENGTLIAEDAKGFKTPEYIIKRKLLLAVHGLRIRET
jgi:hypothetical protein